jgi:hypothetical protein
MTVKKYLGKGGEGGGLPATRVEVLVPSDSKSVANYNPRESLTHTLVQIERLKGLYDGLLDDGAIPSVLTPLNLLQLAQAERTVLQMPGEIAKQQVELYDQIHGRCLQASDDEVSELGAAGEMGGQ